MKPKLITSNIPNVVEYSKKAFSKTVKTGAVSEVDKILFLYTNN